MFFFVSSSSPFFDDDAPSSFVISLVGGFSNDVCFCVWRNFFSHQTSCEKWSAFFSTTKKLLSFSMKIIIIRLSFVVFLFPRKKIRSQRSTQTKSSKIIYKIIRELRHKNSSLALSSLSTRTKKQSMNITLNTVLKINTIVGAAYASNVILGPAK